MPNRDMTGPDGRGAMTGRGMGRKMRRGLGRGFVSQTNNYDLGLLENQARMLKSSLSSIEDRIKQLKGNA